jgi:hypothetical protein
MEGNGKDYRRIFATCVISDFRCEVDENSSLLPCYAAYSGNSLPTFRDNLSVSSSKVKGLSKIRPKGYLETSVRNYKYAMLNTPGEESVHLLGFLTLKKGRICCLETSVRNYRYTLRDSQEERRTHISATFWLN